MPDNRDIYCQKKIVDKRAYGNPRPRLDYLGYTLRAGSPTQWQVKLEGEKIWRRVYVWQFSNAGTLFVRIKGESKVIDL